MRILIDGFNLSLDKGTGIATYARNLSRNLKALSHKVEVLYGTRKPPLNTELMKEIAFFDEHVGMPSKWLRRLYSLGDVLRHPFSYHSYIVPITGTVISKHFSSRLPYFDVAHNSPNLFRWAETHFSLFKRVGNVTVSPPPAIAHWTYPLPLRVPGAKNIFTFHDLVPLRLPFTTLDRKHIYFRLVEKIAREADHIVTVSETSKKDIINVLGVPEQKVTNTYESVEIPEKYLSLDEATLTDELKGAFRLEYKGFLLFYGAIEPKKNVGRMIEAYLASNISMPFVIVGAAAWKSEQELRLLVDDNIRSLVQVGHETLVKRRVIRLDYVTFPQLVNLIRGARCLLFASLYEGFGLPILEAMICHTPVITSDLGSTKEIAGDAAILVDPYDTRDIRNAIIAATTNDELLAQKVAKGRKTSERFSAENYRRRLAELYGRVTSAL